MGETQQSVAGDAERKERVIHTRVPAVLERQLKKFADHLRVPVSNLVRTILEDALNMADAATGEVEERLKRAASKLEHKRKQDGGRLKRRVELDPLSHVLAFQSVTIAQPTPCALCDEPLVTGAQAYMGITEEPPSGRMFVCPDCLPIRKLCT